MNKIKMTEIQKAYYVGREESSSGATGTHLYMEILFNGEPDVLETAFNKVIKEQPFMRARINSEMDFTIEDEFKYKVCVTEGNPNDMDIIMGIRNSLSHKIYSQKDFPLFTIRMLGENGRYRIFLSIDMLISDGLSLYEICKEIKENILNPQKEGESRLEDLLYMANYYQKRRMSNRYFKARDYYMKKIDDILPPPALGYTSTHSNGTFSHLEEFISEEKYNVLCKKAMNKELSATDILLTAYAFVLAKWSRYSNMSINATSFVRQREEKYRTVVGDFTTSMLIQAKVDWNKSFYENAMNLKKALFVAYKNNMFEVPELIREISKKNPGITMPVVFTSMLFDGFDLWDENFVCDYTISQTSQVNLDCQIKKFGNRLNITWDYRKELFEKTNIKKMFDDYIGLIRLFVEQDEDIVEQFISLASEDSCELYKKYNSVAAATPLVLNTTLKVKFEQTVKKYPDKTFIHIDNENYSFDWVYNKAKSLAGRITEVINAKGKNKVRIAFSGNKNISSFINIIAAVLSNNSFCVINEDYGQDKKAETLSQLKNYILIDGDVLILSDDNTTVDSEESYILFTSGTTGKPKGIVINEKAALNTILTINKMFNVTAEDKILNISNLYFDLSIYDVFAAMVLGAEIISVNPMFWSQLSDEKANEITIWNSTPALAKEYASKKKLDKVRVFLLSGDFVSVGLVEDLYQLYSENVKVNSLGGATEASIWSNYFDCSKPHSKNAIPYGYPLLAQELYVVNSDTGLLCQNEVLGEICISGEGLAVGYLDEEQSERAFAYNKQLKKRVYKTGDLGYLGNDGAIYIVGRIAQEIKHNGYRIDLREIEKYINSVENVSNAVVLIERQNEMRTKLSAVVESDDREIDRQIRKYLSSALPYYMIPSNILAVKKFPLTTNGKVDTNEIRLWLKDLDSVAEDFSKEQIELLNVWKKTIFVYTEISHQDATYFDAGGQSLQAVELRNVIAKEYNIDISLQDLMSNISLRAMTELIIRKSEEAKLGNANKINKVNEMGELILLRKGTTTKNIVLIHGGTGEINLFLEFTKYFDKEYNVYGIRRNHNLSNISPKVYNFRLIAKIYNDLLEDINNVEILGGWCIGGSIAYEMSLINPNKFNKMIFINAESPMINPLVFPGFKVETEIMQLNRYIQLTLNSDDFASVDELWNRILDLFIVDDNLRMKLFDSLPEELTRILPKMEGLDARTSIYHLNHLRGAYEARNHYDGGGRSDSDVIYLNASDDPMDNFLHWGDYFTNIEYMDIPGNHISLFDESNVKVWCVELSKKVKEWV